MKRFVSLLILMLSLGCHAQQGTTFVFIKVNEPLQPIARGERYEDPLDAALKAAKLGEVTGGGSSLSKDKRIEWVGLDVELTNVMRGIPFLRRKLIELGAPRGSTLEYELNGKKFEVPVHDGT
jgi:hypothetical protein